MIYDLTELFSLQKRLLKEINYEKQDVVDKLILGMQVEVAECAYEEKSFKFWSRNNQSRTEAMRDDGAKYNPMLEEYIDGLHILLAIGIHTGFAQSLENGFDTSLQRFEDSLTNQFNRVGMAIGAFHMLRKQNAYDLLVAWYMGLGELLGFSWEQMIQAYKEKNEINVRRQHEGY